MTDTHEIRLNINAAAAKRGSRDFTAAITAVKTAIKDLDRDSQNAFSKLQNKKVTVDTSGIKKASTELSSFDAAAKRLELSSKSVSRVAGSQFDRLYEKVQRLSDTDGIRTLSVEMGRLETRLARAQTPLDIADAKSKWQDSAAGVMSLNRQLELQERASNIAATANRNHAAAVDQLRAKYNPLYAASAQYEGTLREIAEAERLGAISAVQASAARKDAASTLAHASTMMTKYGSAMKVAGHQAQNATYQIQDVFVTAEMGMSPMRIALQQGSQLSMVLNDMSRSAGGAKGVISGLGAAVGGMLNPVSLATMGVIAGGAALYQWASSASDASEEAERLTEKHKQLTETQRTLNDTVRGMRLGVSSDELIAMDLLAAKGAEIAKQKEKIAGMEGSRMYMDVIGGERQALEALQKEKAALQDQLSTIKSLQDAKERLIASTRTLADDERTVGEGMQLTGRQLAENELTAELLRQGISASAIAGLDLSRVDMTSGISSASAEALKLASNLQLSLSAALSLKNMQDGLVYSGRGGDPCKMNDQYTRDLNYVDPQVYIDRFNKAQAKASKVRGGGGGRTAKLSDEAKAIKNTTDAIASRHAALLSEARAMELVANKSFATMEAAKLFADAELSGAANVDAKTRAMLAQIDAAEQLKDAQTSPMDAVMGDLEGNFKSALSSALQGDFDLSSIAEGIRASLADAMAEQITDAIFPELNSGASEAAQMQAALTAGGANAAQQIRAAMATGATGAGQKLGSGVRTASIQGASALQRAGITSATSMATGVSAAGSAGATQMQSGIIAGSTVGAQKMESATAGLAGGSSGGGGLFGGNWLGIGVGLLGGLLGGGGGSSSSSSTYTPVTKVSSYYGPDDVPSYAAGTANTSGIPAVLHPNEAVIPLSNNRKVPVEMGSAGGPAPMTFSVVNNVTVEGSEDDQENAMNIATSISERMEMMIEEKMIEHSRYGGYLNPRGS